MAFKNVFFFILATIITYLCYQHYIYFHNYDAHTIISMSIGYRNNLIDSFTTGYITYAPSYRPLAKLFYQFQFWLFGCNPAPWYLMNLVGWIGVAYMIFLVSIQIHGHYIISLMPSLVYLSHGRLLEAQWISSSHNMWTQLCGFGAINILIYLYKNDHLKNYRYYLMLFFILIVCAPLFKEFDLAFFPCYFVFAMAFFMDSKYQNRYIYVIASLIGSILIYVILRWGIATSSISIDSYLGRSSLNLTFSYMLSQFILAFKKIVFDIESHSLSFPIISVIFVIIASFKSKYFVYSLSFWAIILSNVVLCFVIQRQRNNLIGGAAVTLLFSIGVVIVLERLEKIKKIIMVSFVGVSSFYLWGAIESVHRKTRNFEYPVNFNHVLNRFTNDADQNVVSCIRFSRRYQAYNEKYALLGSRPDWVKNIVPFQAFQSTLDTDDLVLNGYSDFSVSIFNKKLFKVSLYLEKKETNCNNVLSSNSLKVIKLNFYKDIGSNEFLELFSNMFTENYISYSTAPFLKLHEAVTVTGPYKKDDVLTVVFYGTSSIEFIALDGRRKKFDDPELTQVFLAIWIGINPPSDSFRSELMGVNSTISMETIFLEKTSELMNVVEQRNIRIIKLRKKERAEDAEKELLKKKSKE